METGQPLYQLWMSFLEMVELLLNTTYALRAGEWLLLLECIRLILPYTFGNDHINYARYLTAMLGDMLRLPEDFSDVYKKFSRFLTISRVETDKVIEMTLKKDIKTPVKLSVYLNWIICKTDILGKIIFLCFKRLLVYTIILFLHDLNQGLCLKAKFMFFPCVEYDKNLYIS